MPCIHCTSEPGAPNQSTRLSRCHNVNFFLELGRLLVGLVALAVPVVLVHLVSRPIPGLDTRVTSTTGGTGPTSDIGILPSSLKL